MVAAYLKTGSPAQVRRDIIVPADPPSRTRDAHGLRRIGGPGRRRDRESIDRRSRYLTGTCPQPRSASIADERSHAERRLLLIWNARLLALSPAIAPGAPTPPPVETGTQCGRSSLIPPKALRRGPYAGVPSKPIGARISDDDLDPRGGTQAIQWTAVVVVVCDRTHIRIPRGRCRQGCRVLQSRT